MTKQTSYRILLLKTHQMVFVDIVEAYIKVELARTIHPLQLVLFCNWKYQIMISQQKIVNILPNVGFEAFLLIPSMGTIMILLFIFVCIGLVCIENIFLLLRPLSIFLSKFTAPCDIAATMFSMNRALRLTLLNYLRQIPYRLLQAKMWIHFSQDIWTSYMNILKVPVPKYLVNEFSLN